MEPTNTTSMKTLTLNEEERSDLGQLLKYASELHPHAEIRITAKNLLYRLVSTPEGLFT